MASRAIGVLRRIGPWLVGVAIVVVIATRVPIEGFRGAIAKGPHLRLAIVDLLITAVVLSTDTLSTWIGLIAAGVRWPVIRVLAVRGATYVLALLNYAVGQAGLGYYLHRSGETPARAVGITLFLTGTTFATLLVLTTGSWAIDGRGGAMWTTLVAGSVALAAYLVVIGLAPRFLVNRRALAPLFDAGLRGHLVAIVGRAPHIAALVLGYWVAMRAWDLDVPIGVAATVMPAVVIATVLPISPAGLGTAQAALVYFFSDYAPGATAHDRGASVLAFGVVHFVYATLGQLLVGVVCLSLAKRQDAATLPAA